MMPPPIHEPWKLDGNNKLVSVPWVLWLNSLSPNATPVSTATGGTTIVSTATVSAAAISALQTEVTEMSTYLYMGEVPPYDNDTRQDALEVYCVMST